MIKAIIWDMDGTFINSEDYWTAMPRVWLKKHGIELTDEEWETAPWRTVGFRAMLRNIYEMGIVENPEPIDEAIVWCKDYMYGTIYQGDQYVKYKPNAPECLAAAYALDIPMCLITATIEPVTDYTLDRLGIAHYFCFRQSTANGMKVALREGNNAEAANYFKAANNASAKANLAVIDVLNGDYKAAAAKLAGQKGCNVALVALLNGDLAAAANATCKCPTASYIKAIAAARQGNADAVKANIEAAKADPALAARYEKDIEFAQYR